MGGRGARSGISDHKVSKTGKVSGGNAYGSQYHSLYQSGNIKFVQKNSRQSEDLMETMTKGRVYATIGGNEVKSITYFDKNNMRVKQIDLERPHKGMQPHVHHGYKHNENDGKKGATKLTPKELKMVENVTSIWDNHIKQNK